MEDIVSDKQDIVIGRFRLRTWPRGLGIDIGNRSVNINSGDTWNWDCEICFFWKNGQEKTREFHNGWYCIWWDWWPFRYATYSHKDASRANRNRDSMPTENVRARIKKRQAGA